MHGLIRPDNMGGARFSCVVRGQRGGKDEGIGDNVEIHLTCRNSV